MRKISVLLQNVAHPQTSSLSLGFEKSVCYITVAFWSDKIFCRRKVQMKALQTILHPGKVHGRDVWHTNLRVLGLTTCRLCFQRGLIPVFVYLLHTVGPAWKPMWGACRAHAQQGENSIGWKRSSNTPHHPPIALHTSETWDGVKRLPSIWLNMAERWLRVVTRLWRSYIKIPFWKGQANLGTFHRLRSTVGFCDPHSPAVAHSSPYHKHLKMARLWPTLALDGNLWATAVTLYSSLVVSLWLQCRNVVSVNSALSQEDVSAALPLLLLAFGSSCCLRTIQVDTLVQFE